MKKFIITSTVITSTLLGAINIRIASANRNLSYQVPQDYSLAQNGAECGEQLESYLGLYQGKAVVINSPKRTSGELFIEIDRETNSSCILTASVEEFAPLGGKGILRGSFAPNTDKQVDLIGTLSHQTKPKVWDVQMNLRLIDENTIQGSSKWIPKSGIQDTKIYQETFTATKSRANTTDRIGGRDNSNIPNQTSTQSVAQNSSESNSHIYEDDIIKVKAVAASFDKSGQFQASLSLENKTTQDLLLALEGQGPAVISDLGESTTCYGIAGIKTYVGTQTTSPSSYSRLKPKQKLTIGITRCGGISSKANSFSINMPLVRLIDEQPTQPFTVDISDIPIRKK